MEFILQKWLLANELEKYNQVLLDNDINTLDLIYSLTPDDLKELGFSLGDRKRFEKAIAATQLTPKFSEGEQTIISTYPYVIAYPFKRMLEEPDGKDKLDLLVYTFLNGLKYIGLTIASEYFNSTLKSTEINELFREKLYQPHYGHWNHFIRETIAILVQNNTKLVFPEVLIAYDLLETNKNAKRYKTSISFTSDEGLIEWRNTNETAIGTLINFRNRYLGHGLPAPPKNECKALFESIYPVFLDFLTGLRVFTSLSMVKSDKIQCWLLMGDDVLLIPNLKPEKDFLDSIWLQHTNGERLKLLPFFVLPGQFAGIADKAKVFVYEQTNGARIEFFSPESLRAEATSIVLDKLKLLMDEKENEEQIHTDSFTSEHLLNAFQRHNAKMIQSLKKEKKVIEGVYQERKDAESALRQWIGANTSLFFIASIAGSGKTNLLATMLTQYIERGYTALLIRASRSSTPSFTNELATILNVAEDFEFVHHPVFNLTNDKPLLILVDGVNEHRDNVQYLYSIVAFLEQFTEAGIKVVATWRVDLLSELPQVPDGWDKIIYPATEHANEQNVLAKKAFRLLPMDKVEVASAWNQYVNIKDSIYKPQFNINELILGNAKYAGDRPMAQQLENPLLLRLFLELFNGKSLKHKPKGFANLWGLWWKKISEHQEQAEFLLALAEIMATQKTNRLELDELFNHPNIGYMIRNIQVDSPYQQLINKGILSQYFNGDKLELCFTIEASRYYILSKIFTQLQPNADWVIFKIGEHRDWVEALKFYLWDLTYQKNFDLLCRLIDLPDFDVKIIAMPLAQAIYLHGAEVVLPALMENPTQRDWNALQEAWDYLGEMAASVTQKQLAEACYQMMKASNYYPIDFALQIWLYLDFQNKEDLLSTLENQSVQFEENSKGANLCSKWGHVYYSKGDYDRALEYHEKSLAIELKVHGGEHPDVAISYNYIGIIWRSKGEYDRALEFYEKSLAIKLKVHGGEHPSVASSYNNIGIIWKRKGDCDRALEYQEKSLAIRLKVHGGEHPDVAISYNYIGIIWKSKGEYDRALEYHEKSLAIFLKVYGEVHPFVATSYRKFGNIWKSKGDYDRALEFFEKHLAIELKVYGAEHPDVATSYSHIGNIWYNKGEYDRALEFYEKRLAIELKVHGAEHPEVATSYSNIGYIWESKGEYDRALEYKEKSLAIYLKVHGGEHPSVARRFNYIGRIWESKGDYDRALEYHEKSLEIWLKVHGGVHPFVAKSYSHIGNIWKSKGENDRALEYHEKRLAIELKVLGSDHPDVAKSKDYIEAIKTKIAEQNNL